MLSSVGVTTVQSDLLVLDVSPLVWRSAMGAADEPKPELAFERMLVRILDEHPHSRAVAALDCKGPTWRHLAYPPYKGRRPEVPGVVREVKKYHRNVVLGKLGISWYHYPLAEADDIIASFAAQSINATVITPDKDMYSILGINGTKIYDDSQKVWWSEDHCMEKHGVRPDQMPDYLAMAGDRVDNIPGISKIGPKKAAALLKKYNSVEGLYRQLAADNTGLKTIEKKLWAVEFEVRLYKQLTSLCFDLPI